MLGLDAVPRRPLAIMHASKIFFELVGATGFEPATLCPPGKCATRLRHAPTAGRGNLSGIAAMPTALTALGQEELRAGNQETRPLLSMRAFGR